MTPTANYLQIAKSWIGTAEVAGAKSNERIKQMWFALPGGAWFWSNFGCDDSKLPWCGAFVAHILKKALIEPPHNYARALSWADYGMQSSVQALGAIVVLKRDGGGHVGFVTGIDSNSTMVRVLGANQNNAVNELWFDIDRIAAARQPVGIKLALAPIEHVGEFSKSEA
jgi:uncharacterized protein (TIGR02594 family)